MKQDVKKFIRNMLDAGSSPVRPGCGDVCQNANFHNTQVELHAQDMLRSMAAVNVAQRCWQRLSLCPRSVCTSGWQLRHTTRRLQLMGMGTNLNARFAAVQCFVVVLVQLTNRAVLQVSQAPVARLAAWLRRTWVWLFEVLLHLYVWWMASSTQTYDVANRTLSSLVRQYGITKISLLKIDVEGAELQVSLAITQCVVFLCLECQITGGMHTSPAAGPKEAVCCCSPAMRTLCSYSSSLSAPVSVGSSVRELAMCVCHVM
jgi:FkbM family methyltransferase